MTRCLCLLLRLILLAHSLGALENSPQVVSKYLAPNLLQNAPTAIMNSAPALPFCRLGQRFLLNYIMFICHHFGDELRGFRPFACAVRNQPDSKLLTKNSSADDTFFRYKCVDNGAGTLKLTAITCLINEIQIRVGESLRRGRNEYTCLKDEQGMLKIMEKQMLHDYCLVGNRNESLVDGDRCPGITTNVIHAHFGSGSEVVFDTKQMVIVPNKSAGKHKIEEH